MLSAKINAWLIAFSCIFFSVSAQNKSSFTKAWNAYWVAVPNEPAQDYGV
jgi:hypothetical protein